MPPKTRSSFIPRRSHQEEQILALQNRTDCTIQQKTIFVDGSFMAMMSEIKPCHPVQNDDEFFESSRQQTDQRMFDQPQHARILNANKHTLNSPIFHPVDLFGSCQESQIFDIQNFPYFHPQNPQPITPIDEFIKGHQTLPTSQHQLQSRKSNKRQNSKSQTNVEPEKTQKTSAIVRKKKGKSGPFQARFLRKYMNKCLSPDTDETSEMKNQAQNENHSQEKTDINLSLVQRIRRREKDRRFNYLQLNLITLNPKFLKFLHEVGNQQFQDLHNVISKEQASKEQLDKAISKMNYLRVLFGWGNIFQFYPGFTEKIILMVVISVLKKLYKLFDLRIRNLENFNETTKKSYQIPKDLLGEEKLVDEEQEIVQASEKSQEKKHKYDIPQELKKPRELFAKLCEQDDKLDAQKRSKLIEELKTDQKIIFQMIERLGNKDTTQLLSQEAYQKEFDPSILYFSQIEKWQIQGDKLITKDNLKDRKEEMDSETIGQFFLRNKRMGFICILFYFIINLPRNGKPTKKDIEEKVGPLNGEKQEPEAQLIKKESKRNGKAPKTEMKEKVVSSNVEEQEPGAQLIKKERKRKTINKPKTRNIKSERKLG